MFANNRHRGVGLWTFAAWLAAAALLGLSASAQTTFYVNGTCGDDAWTGLSQVCEAPDGPKATIQAGLDAAGPGDTVLVADGVYSGAGNVGLRFPPPSVITLRSENGPESCTIDAAGAGTAFLFVINEPPEAVIDGFTITGATTHAFFMHHECRVTVRNCIITGNSSSRYGAGALIENTSAPAFIDCVFSDNTAPLGAALLVWHDTSPTLINCVFTNNTADEDGGALYIQTFGRPTLVNCLIADNTAGDRGGAVFVAAGRPELINTTISGNVAGEAGGAIFAIGSPADVSVAGSVLWGDSAPIGAEIALGTVVDTGGADLAVRYSTVEGGEAGVFVEPGSSLTWGDGNLALDPMFVDPAAGNFRLAARSPAIDAGDNLALPPDTFDLDRDGDTTEPIPIDLDRNPRHHDDEGTEDIGNPGPPGPIADMGAYEFQGFSCRADFNGDGEVDTRDFAAFLNAWAQRDPSADFNRDGEIDTRDFTAFLNALAAGCP